MNTKPALFWATVSGEEESMVAVAPSCLARAKRSGLMSSMMILVAPLAMQDNRDTSPIGPAPNIKTEEPVDILALWHACNPTDSGSNRAPSSKETCSGSFYCSS